MFVFFAALSCHQYENKIALDPKCTSKYYLEIAKKNESIFHTDAVQAIGKVSFDLKDIDLY